MINFRKAVFVKSAADSKGMLYDRDQVVFIGRSNVGKSSLVNALIDNKSFAFVSRTPGRTQLLNYFLIDDNIYFVDAPGYGFTDRSDLDFTRLMDNYFYQNSRLKGIIWLLDSRRSFTREDLIFKDYLIKIGVEVEVVFTKCDKLNQSEKALIRNVAAKELPNVEYIMFSTKDKKSIELLQNKISKIVA